MSAFSAPSAPRSSSSAFTRESWSDGASRHTSETRQLAVPNLQTLQSPIALDE